MQEQLRKLRLLPQASAQRMAVQRDFRRAAEDLRNVEGGFFTAAADSSVAHRAVIGSVLRAEVNAFASLTDGATRFTEVFRLGDWTDLLAVISEEGTQALINRVRKAELLGDGRTAKIHDDATAVYVAF